MNIIGRKSECEYLKKCLNSKRPEFVALYGRRRVGKTYLIKEYFNNKFAFYATGVTGVSTREQLKLFNVTLMEYGSLEKTIPEDWYEAFRRLRYILESDSVYADPVSGKKVVFLDELPWMDNARSNFKSALDYFWNSWGSSQEDLLLIVCGSATTWILENLLGSTGGFYNRITGQIHLCAFTLSECEALLKSNNINWPREQIVETYMVFGGIPYYYNLFDSRLSLAQNIDELLFKENGNLYYEYERLFGSLFKHPERHFEIIRTIAHKRMGVTRTELAANKKIGDGEPLTKALKELEQSGFIRKYRNYTKEKSGFFYQVIDPFVLFCLEHIEVRRLGSWMGYLGTPGYYSWCGNAFETVCLNHITEIKKALGISGVETMEYAFRSAKSKPGAQIDLLIDRKDSLINLCEIKFTRTPFEIDADYEKNLLNKADVFSKETGTGKALHITLITANGLKTNDHSHVVQNVLTAEDLFE